MLRRWVVMWVGALVALSVVSPPGASAATALTKYAVSSDFVAGISSGADMAVQLQVAYSSRFKGAGIFAGAPYYCAQGSALQGSYGCASNIWSDHLATLESDTTTWAGSGLIDATSNLSGRPVYLWHGTQDTTVAASVMNDTASYFSHFGSKVTYVSTVASGHGWISPIGPNACSATASPYVNNCPGTDPEHDMLALWTGSVKAPNTGTLTGSVVAFDQNQYAPGGSALAVGLDNTGYEYVPSSCATGSTCRLVVTLHGCLQSFSNVGSTFMDTSYLKQYADTNNLVVLFPQVIGTGANPNACWDWWGYLGGDTTTSYAQRSGPQMTAVMNMVTASGG